MTEAVITDGVTGPDAPAADTTGAAAPPRPEGLPENFDSVEALVASYKEAQAKLTKTNQQTDANQDTSEGTDDDDNSDDKKADDEDQDEQVISQLPENLQPFSTEFEADGKLSEDSYTKLGELGYSKDVVDAYIKGAQGGETVEAPSTDDVVAIKAAVGGEEAFTALQGWAGENLSDDDLSAYNSGITNKATAKMAVEWLQSRMDGVEGFKPTVKVEGAAAVSTAAQPFKNGAELSRAMRDPLYKAGDKVYHKMIEDRLSASPAMFGK